MYTSIGSCGQGVYLIVMVNVKNWPSSRKPNSHNIIIVFQVFASWRAGGVRWHYEKVGKYLTW